jgi:hypothetical protein
VRLRGAVIPPTAEVNVADSRQTGYSFTKRGIPPMDPGTLSHLLHSLTLDGSILAVVALLTGAVAGWTLTNWHDQQLQTRKLKVNRKS